MIYLELFVTFFKIGAFTFGGGYAMLPLIQSEVLAKGWMKMEELVNFVAISEGTPGPFAVNIATYIGTETAGFVGALCATTGVVLPSMIIITLIAKFFSTFHDNRIVRGCMSGLKPAVIGMIGSAVLSVGQTVFFSAGFSLSVFTSAAFLGSAVIFVFMLFLELRKIHPNLIIVLSAVLGIAFGYLQKAFPSI